MSEDGGDVLLVEDNAGDVRLTQEAFEDGTHRLHVVTDGVAALDFLHQRGEYEDAPRSDLVLLDLNLPRKDGEAVLTEIREDPVLGNIPVIILTSSDVEEDVREAYDRRANAYLTKPVDPTEFIETIRTMRRYWLSVTRLPPITEE
jgi:CheY-like chemotaxis protein